MSVSVFEEAAGNRIKFESDKNKELGGRLATIARWAVDRLDETEYEYLQDADKAMVTESCDPSRSNDSSVVLLKKLDGRVTAVMEDYFVASFEESASDASRVIAEFDKEELDESCQKILTEGIPLIWSIVREKRRGTISRKSIVYVRRVISSMTTFGHPQSRLTIRSLTLRSGRPTSAMPHF